MQLEKDLDVRYDRQKRMGGFKTRGVTGRKEFSIAFYGQTKTDCERETRGEKNKRELRSRSDGPE